MPNKSIGTIEVLNFRSTRYDNPFSFPISAIFNGYSTGHVAFILRFSEQKLFDQYVANNPRIPHLELVDNKTGKHEHIVYLSFWPNKDTPWNNFSILETHRYDSEQSANGSPVDYNDKFSTALQPAQKFFTSRVPMLAGLFYNSQKLPPAIILHTSRLESCYGKEVAAAAELYARHYTNWRLAVVDHMNAELLNCRRVSDLTLEVRAKISAKIVMMVSEEKLRSLMSPDQELNHAEFMHKLEPFVSFGYPERDSVQLPLIKTTNGVPSKQPGLELEPMLQYIKEVADHPWSFPYGLFKINCARIAFNTLWNGVKHSTNTAFKEQFNLPWYIRWFGLTLTPILILRLANNAALYIKEQKQPIIEDPLPEPDRQENMRKMISLKLTLKSEILGFTRQNSNQQLTDTDLNASVLRNHHEAAKKFHNV